MNLTKNIKPAPGSPQFRWNSVSKRYIAPNGRFVSIERVRQALNDFIDLTTGNMKALSQDLVEGRISLGAWQKEMQVLIKQTNLAGASVERGGWYQMTPSDFGAVGQKIRGEYEYLQNFANQIASGEQRLDGTLWSRAQLYGQQGRVTYHDFAAREASRQGMDEESSTTTGTEHCQSCIDEEDKGWVPRGTLKPIGDRTCLSHCNCFMSYRNSATGAKRTV